MKYAIPAVAIIAFAALILLSGHLPLWAAGAAITGVSLYTAHAMNQRALHKQT